MGRLKRKRYLLAVMLALGAFGVTLAVVFAGFIQVQGSRDQGVLIEGVTLETLPGTDMSIFEDKLLTKEITPADLLVFKVF